MGLRTRVALCVLAVSLAVVCGERCKSPVDSPQDLIDDQPCNKSQFCNVESRDIPLEKEGSPYYYRGRYANDQYPKTVCRDCPTTGNDGGIFYRIGDISWINSYVSPCEQEGTAKCGLHLKEWPYWRLSDYDEKLLGRTFFREICEPCLPGTYSNLFTCLECGPNEYQDEAGQSSCKSCDPGKFSGSGQMTCLNCAVGWYRSSDMGACEECDGQWSCAGAGECSTTPRRLRDDDTCVSCAEMLRECKDGEFLSGCGYYSDGECTTCSARGSCEPGHQWECREYSEGCFPCPPGTYKSASGTEPCTACATLCLVGQQRRGCEGVNAGDACVECQSPTVECAEGEYFECSIGSCVSCLDAHRCPRGSYVRGCQDETRGECARCECSGELTGCGGLEAGTCQTCAACENGEERVGCYTSGLTFHAGVCRPLAVLARSPECPLTGGLLSDVSAEPAVLCSTACDGRGGVDTQQCDGPWACSTARCTPRGAEPHACPVTMDARWRAGAWDDAMWDTSDEAWKLEVRCQSCDECGGHQLGFEAGPGWGGGCADECSQALCDAGDIYDWTEKRCVRCDELWNAELCANAVSPGHNITGNLLPVRFKDCVARGDPGVVGYGTCVECDNKCLASNQFPDSGCECSQCRRLGAESRDFVDSAGETRTVYCQRRVCEDGLTGVYDDGQMCETPCKPMACSVGEIRVPCQLPHNTRCVAAWPARGGGARELVGTVADTANLLEVATGPAHRWSSFENLLVVMDARVEQRFQCVWNAAGIKDSVFAPGGVGAVFWANGVSAAAEYRERGTKLCRSWPGGREHPLLPLQNAVAFEGDARRRVLVNSSARAVAYAHNGVVTVPGELDIVSEIRKPDSVRDPGDLLLALDLHDTVQLQVHVPTDRDIPKWARWIRFSFLVQELTKTPPAEPLTLRVEALGLPPLFLTSARAQLPLDLVFPPSVHSRFVSGYAEILGVRASGRIAVTERVGDIFDCCPECIACATLGLGDADKVVAGDGDVVVNVTLGAKNVSLLAAAVTPRAHHCLLVVATLAGVFCVEESALVFVSDVVADALVFVESDVVLLRVDTAMQAYKIPDSVCDGCECVHDEVNVNSVANNVHARAMALRGDGEVLEFGRVNTEWAVRLLYVAYGAVVGVNVRLGELVCAVTGMYEFDTCTMQATAARVVVACGASDMLHVFTCTAGADVDAVEVEAPGWYVSLALVGERALVGRGHETWWVSGGKVELVDAGLDETVFVRAGGGLVVFEALVWPGEHCNNAWEVETLQRDFVPCVKDTDDGCQRAAVVARRAQVRVAFAGAIVTGAVLARSALSLDDENFEWMPAQTVRHRGVERLVTTWDMKPVVAGGSGSKYIMPSAVRNDGAWVNVVDTWTVPLDHSDELYVFRVFGATELICNNVRVAACTDDFFSVEFDAKTRILEVYCSATTSLQRVEVNCLELTVRGAADIVYYSHMGGDRDAVIDLVIAHEDADDHCSGRTEGLLWVSCAVVRSASGVLLTFPHSGEMRTVGIDEIELQPMLSARTIELAVELAEEDAWSVDVYVPSAVELHAVGAAQAVRTESWHRTHVLVGVFARAPCMAAVRVGSDSGCNATVYDAGKRWYGACALEVPEHKLDEARHVQVYVHGCADVERIEASVPAGLALWECGVDEYWAPEVGACKSCYSSCAPGQRAQACNVLTGTSACAACDPSPLMADYVSGCEWQCMSGHYRDGNVCRECSEKTCSVSEVLVPCDVDSDAECEPCAPQAHAVYKAAKCQAECNAGYFRSARGQCEACTPFDAVEVVRAAGVFYRRHNCTRVSDAFAEACVALENAVYVADGRGFGEDCELECAAGWHRRSDTTAATSPIPETGLLNEYEKTLSTTVAWAQRQCVQCTAPKAVDGSALPVEAYRMHDNCTLECQTPWLPRRFGTCVNCDVSKCAVGQYLTGELCDECTACELQHIDSNFRFTSHGALDRNDSCAERCVTGMFDEFELGVCKTYSEPTCGVGEFLHTGTATTDYSCEVCSSCLGARLVADCTTTSDAECEVCVGELLPGETWTGSTCNKACRTSFVRDVASGACEYCDFVCPPGTEVANPRLYCSHCAPCASPAIADTTWVAGCDWACAEGFAFESAKCVARPNNTLVSAAMRTTVACPLGSAPSGVFECTPCNEVTVTPPIAQVGVTWEWHGIGLPCEWHCLAPLVKHRINGGLGVACVSWSAYRAAVRVAGDSSGLLAVPAPMPINTLTRWEFLVAAGCVLALVVGLLVFLH